MDTANEVRVQRLPPDLPQVVTDDGIVCLMDTDTLWVPAPIPMCLHTPHTLLPYASHDEKFRQTEILELQGREISYSDSSHHETRTDISHMSSQLSFDQDCDPDLSEIRPETFTCVLPGIDHPQTSPVALTQSFHQFQSTESSQGKTHTSTAHVDPLPEPYPRTSTPRKPKTKSLPESMPLFDPIPLGQRHAMIQRPQSKNSLSFGTSCSLESSSLSSGVSLFDPISLGERHAQIQRPPSKNSFSFEKSWSSESCALRSAERSAHDSENRGTCGGTSDILPMDFLSQRNDNRIQTRRKLFDESSNLTYSYTSPVSTTGSFSPAGNDHDVELYYSEVPGREKTGHSPQQISLKRKCSVDRSGDILGAGKVARIDARDVTDEMELLRAVESLASVTWSRPGA